MCSRCKHFIFIGFREFLLGDNVFHNIVFSLLLVVVPNFYTSRRNMGRLIKKVQPEIWPKKSTFYMPVFLKYNLMYPYKIKGITVCTHINCTNMFEMFEQSNKMEITISQIRKVNLSALHNWFISRVCTKDCSALSMTLYSFPGVEFFSVELVLYQ